MLRSFRTIAWLLVILLTLMSIAPPWLRPSTDLSHNVEHFAALFVTGLTFGLGYGRRPVMVALILVLFCAVIEIVQLFVPGRHSRLSDFIVDAAAAMAGVAVAFLAGVRGQSFEMLALTSLVRRRKQGVQRPIGTSPCHATACCP
jgi:VanZ family protein